MCDIIKHYEIEMFKTPIMIESQIPIFTFIE